MYEMADSIVVKRMVRNLRYRLTYVQLLAAFLEPTPDPEVVQLFDSLMTAQQSAIASLTSYLSSLGVGVQDLGPEKRLLEHASHQQGVRARLRFVHSGFSKAVSWYKTQLTDKQMTADPELRQLLIQLGEIEAAKLWRVEAVMDRLRIPLKPDPENQHELQRVRPQRTQDWHARLLEDVGRPAWKGK